MLGYFVVRGQSMEPLCKEGDFVLLDKLSYLMFRPRAGDVVVLHHPQEDRLILKYIVEEKVKERHSFYWVEGLNKEGSSDSRNFGWVSREMILGKVQVIHR
ncbi:MAG: S26 family signal peptidase [Nanoarchaeota archaeon]